MTYKLADTNEEFDMVSRVYQEYSSYTPNFELSFVLLAKEGNEIIGFTMVQPALHVEPTWVHPDSRGRIDVKELVSKAVKLVGEATPYIFSSGKGMTKMLKDIGFKELPWTILTKE